jgi:multidrug efflux system outer membrane protein
MKSRRPRVIGVAVLCFLVGCSSPEAYRRPTTDLPAQWGTTTAVTANANAIGWESLYADGRLKALIRTALEKNHDVRMALARMEEARALWGVQRADQVPNIALGASHTNSSIPPLVQGSNATAINTHRYDVGLNLLSFELDLWGRIASLTEAAKLGYLATEEDRRTVRMGLVNDVANAYFAWLESEERQRLATQTERGRAEALELTRRRRDLGAASDYDVAIAQSAWQTARSDLIALQRQTDQAQNALTLLLGGRWPHNLPAGLPLDLQNLELQWGANLSSSVLLQRPDVMAAEKRLQAAHANIHAARVAFLPRLQLTGLAGTASPGLSNLFTRTSNNWNFVPSLQQPIFDGGRTGSGVDLALARENQAVVAYEKTLQKPSKRWPTCWSQETR